MKLSKTSAQAALALSFLSTCKLQEFVQARHVAEHLGIPTDSMLKILQALARNNLIQSQLGRNGGYRLSRAMEQVTLLQVVEVIDGPLSGRMPLHQVPEQAADSFIALQECCSRTADVLRAELARITIADLVGVPESASCAMTAP
jgi:Rrf2 family protein